MTLSDFENYVPSKILARGEEYYISDAIEEIEEISPDKWRATVIGNEAYTVTVCLEGDKITSYDCDCPYEGNLCKHVVATLLTIRNNNNKKKKHFTPPVEKAMVIMEEVPVVKDETMVIQTIKKRKTMEDIEKLVSFIAPEALATFVCEYATMHADLREALQQKFTPTKNKTNPTTSYSKEIQDCFASSYHRSPSYNRYHDYEENLDVDDVSSQLDVYLDKATFLLEQKSFGDVASIALQIFRSIGEFCDEDQEYAIYDDEYLFTDNCETAAALLLQLAENTEVPQALKDYILDELCHIATFASYHDYSVYDVDTLVDDVNRISQSKEGAMKRIDKMLSEEKKDSSRTNELVTQKIELLHELDRHKEANEVIEKYLYLPRIRKRKINRLMDEKKYEEALQTIDQGIETAQELGNHGTVFDWKKEKLSIYQQTSNTPLIIVTAKDMFISDRDKIESYRLLKKYISHEEWKPFLKSIMQQADLSSHSFFGSSIEADIYVAEKDEKQLMDFLNKISPSQQLNALRNYAHHLKNNYSAEILAIYTQRIQEYAERNMGRNHYEYVASVLSIMKEFKEGTKAVSELVQLLRTKYKKRPAMMDELRKF